MQIVLDRVLDYLCVCVCVCVSCRVSIRGCPVDVTLSLTGRRTTARQAKGNCAWRSVETIYILTISREPYSR